MPTVRTTCPARALPASRRTVVELGFTERAGTLDGIRMTTAGHRRARRRTHPRSLVSMRSSRQDAADMSFDRAQLTVLFRRGEARGVPSGVSASGSADAMDIVLRG